MKTVKKLLALLLAMVMILGMLPLGTLAQENGHDHLEGCTGEDCTAEGCTCRCHYRHLDTCLEGCTGTLAEGEACECDCHFVHLETCLADCAGTVEVDGQTQECACECHDHIEVCVENCVGETKDGEACACSCHHTVETCTLDCAGEDCDCVCHQGATLNLEKPAPETKCGTCGSTEHTTENHPKEEPKDETKCATCNSTEHTTENHPKEEPKDETKCATCNSTEHTTENHPKEEPKDETKCATCNSTEHTTENHPAEETKCGICGSAEHTTENHPADVTKCGICGGGHADADCTYCLLCKGDNSQCVICEECGTHAGDHTSTCTKRPCETCKKNPCECACETCGKFPCECPEVCEDCGEEICVCNICEECGALDCTEGHEKYGFVAPDNFTNVAGLVPREKPVVFRRLLKSTKPERQDREEIETTKTVSYDKDSGEYTLRLTSYVKGTETQEKVPADIVLVLDQSGSMARCMESTCMNQVTDQGDGCSLTKAYSGANKTYVYLYRTDYTNKSEAFKVVAYCEKCASWAQLINSSGGLTSHFKSNGSHAANSKFAPRKSSSDTERTGQLYQVCLTNRKKLEDVIEKPSSAPSAADGCSTTRTQALQSAAKTFITTVKGNADSEGVDHRIAVVGFAAENANSEVMTYVSGGVLDDKDHSELKDATETLKAEYFGQSMRSVRTDSELLIDAVDSLNHGGSTRTDLGLTYAANIFKYSENADRDRNKVVVLLTDGEPTTNSYYNPNIANNALVQAENLKDDNTTIYTIGIFSGAKVTGFKDGNKTHTLPSVKDEYLSNSSADLGTTIKEGKTTTEYYEAIAPISNRFMHLVSSNYRFGSGKTAHMKATGAEFQSDAVYASSTPESYYLTAANGSALTQIFAQIANKIKPTGIVETMDASTVVKDYVTSSFTITGTPTAWTETYKGTTGANMNWEKASTDADLTPVVNKETNEVSVTGFSFKDNVVGETTDRQGNKVITGKRLVIEIPIKPNADFLGGNGVPTNESTSAIYNAAGGVLEHFDIPELNIPVKEIIPAFKTGNIYLGEAATVPHIANVGHFQYQDDGKTTDGVTDGINNGYVDIIYTVSDAEGNNSISFTLQDGTAHSDHGVQNWTVVKGALDMNPLLYQDATYKVTAQVVPSISAQEAGTDDAGQAPVDDGEKTEEEEQILVFKPYITFHDSTMNYGETANYEGTDSQNTVAKNIDKTTDIVWKHGDTAPDQTIMGLPPVLTFTYAPPAEAFRLETPVQVTKVVPTDDPKAYDGDNTGIKYKHGVPEVAEGEEPQNLVHEVSFYRAVCDFDGCAQKTATEATSVTTSKAENAVWTNFVVHLNPFDLTITKQGADMAADPDVSFIFRVTGPYDFSQDVVIYGNGSVTLKDLPGGDYTVTELTDWSWRYEVENKDNQPKNPQTGNGTNAALTFVNNRNENKWLDGNAYCDNSFVFPATSTNGN